MKKNIYILFLLLGSVLANGQHSLIYTHPDTDFDAGKSLFQLGKYTASYRSFEKYLQDVKVTNQSQQQEAEFYMVSCVFELRKKDAAQVIQAYNKKYPGTLFQEKLDYMEGLLLFEEKDFAGALNFFNKIKENRFNKKDKLTFLYHKAYALLQTSLTSEASVLFHQISQFESSLKRSATYYYAYSEYKLQHFETALPIFNELENDSAYKMQVPYYKVQIFYQQNQLDSVFAKSNQLLKEYPNNPENAELYRIMGEIAYEKRNYAEAISQLSAYEKMAENPLRNDLYIMGVAYYQTFKFNQAAEYLKRVTTDEDAMSENAFLYLGNAYMKQNDKYNARLAFESALRTRFDASIREQALFNYALTTYETTSAFGESVAAFEQFLYEFPNSKHSNEAQNYLASELMASRNFTRSLESVNKIAKPNTSLLETKQYLLYQLGTEAFASRDLDQAINHFSKALSVIKNGKYAAECYYWRSECYFQQGKMNASIDDLNDFFTNANAPDSRNYLVAHYALGYAYFTQKEYAAALTWFEKFTHAASVEKSGIYADALNRSGDCHFYLRNFRKAENAYLMSVDASPNTGDYANFQSAYVAGLQKNYATKISRLKRLIDVYPNSEYADDAMYEIGRAFIMLDNENEAIRIYQQLLLKLPNSSLARKAAVETGMIYDNQGKSRQAIAAFKEVIADYPGTEEAYTALESLENIYIGLNEVKGFLDYTKTLNMTMVGQVENRQDSISYIAAERQYMNGNYAVAIDGFNNYLTNYCKGGRYCTSAQYFMADSHYRLKNESQALDIYKELLQISGNQYMEDVVLKCAEISFNLKNFKNALQYFTQLNELAQSVENRQIARLGMLRSAVQVSDYQTIMSIAGILIGDVRSGQDEIMEARFRRAKALLATSQINQATEDLKILSEDTRTVQGAESRYLLAKTYFDQNDLTAAENEVMAFAKKNTPHAYWLARSFVLLSDIYIRLENDFQARQYLLSLKKNYTVKDDIQTMIQERLAGIDAREKKTKR